MYQILVFNSSLYPCFHCSVLDVNIEIYFTATRDIAFDHLSAL